MGRSANRVGDEVLCDEHPSAMGRVTAGSGNVNEAQRSVSRLGDPALCPGESLLSISPHTSFATEGSATVLINRRPAVRHGDGITPKASTLVGANMVFIGGPSVALPSNMSVEGSDRFKGEVFAQLGLIAGTRSGQRLFADIQAAAPRTVRIVEHDPERYPGKHLHSSDEADHGLSVWQGTGGNSRIEYYPRNVEEGLLDDHPALRKGAASDDVILFHELMHARGQVNAHYYPKAELSPDQYKERTHPDDPMVPVDVHDHGYHGTCRDRVADRWNWCGEHRAVGIYPYEDAEVSENTYRKERGYPPRTYY